MNTPRAYGTPRSVQPVKTILRLFSVFVLAVSSLGSQPTPNTIDASRYPTLQAAIDTAPDHSVVQIPAGVYSNLSTVMVRKNVSLIGAGIERTFIVPAAGSTGVVIKYDPAATISAVEISGFTINLGNAHRATALELNNLGAPKVHNIRVHHGAIGLLLNATGSGHFSDLTFENQDLAGIRINGDSGAENHWNDISIVRSQPGVMQAGFELVRTTDADLGGQYLSRVRVNEILGAGGTIVNGFRFVSSKPNSQVYLSVNQCVADAMSGGDAWLFQNVSDIRDRKSVV